MSYHKARPDDVTRDPNKPYSTAMVGGRVPAPHGEVDNKPYLGGIQNATVEGEPRTPKEEAEKVKEFREDREQVKKVAKETFDEKTGEPKAEPVKFGPTPQQDAQAAPNDGGAAPPAEVKKNVEDEKRKVEPPKK